MTIPHRILRLVFALATGLLLAFYAWERASDPELRARREREEAAVLAARAILGTYVGKASTLEIVDPLAPKRAVGKAFIYPAGSGWEVSGHYRRDRSDHWHPFLMRLDGDLSLVELSVRDAALAGRAATDPKLVIRP
jgi:hypothetical protein